MWQVRPGLVSKDSDGKLTCRPIFSRIVSLFAEQNELQYAVPGGLIGVGTKIEPTLCRADRLVGQVRSCSTSFIKFSQKKNAAFLYEALVEKTLNLGYPLFSKKYLSTLF